MRFSRNGDVVKNRVLPEGVFLLSRDGQGRVQRCVFFLPESHAAAIHIF